MNKLHSFLMLPVLSAAFIVGATAQTKDITPEIIADLRFVTNAAMDPSGNTVAYTLFVPRAAGDEVGSSYTELWTMPYKGGAAQKRIGSPESASSPQWSPDGRHIYFAAKRAGHKKRQVYRIPAGDTAVSLVTNFENGVGGFVLSPDGKTIAFTSGDNKEEEEKERKKAGTDWVVYGKDYKYDRLYTWDIGSGEVHQAFPDNLHVDDMTWTPDSKTIVFMAAATPEVDHAYMYRKIYKVPVAGGKPVAVCRTEGKLGNMEVSPDGATLAFAGAVDLYDPLPQSIFIAPMQGGDTKNLTPAYPASVTHVTWLSNAEVLFTSSEGTTTTLNKVEVTGSKQTKLYSGGVIIGAFSLDRKNGRIAFTGNTDRHPSELFVSPLHTIVPLRLTDSNPALKDVRLGKQEAIEWKAPDGMTIQGILNYPVDYKPGNRYPLLLQIHGGPEGVSLNGWGTRPVYPVQLYCASGYFVLQPNYRGSQGRGVAYGKADHKDLGGKEYDDVLAGIDKLIADGKVDAAKVGTGGFSYGGYFSAWGATKHSDRFKASMVGAGIFNWLSFQGTTDIILENTYVHWNLFWYEDISLVMDRSPIAHINNAKTPTLIVHGEADDRVPPSQSIEMYNALKLKNVPTELVIYKRQPHGIRERAAQIDFMGRTLDWFNKYVKGIEQ